jgi:prepilin-type processing-associated H-X9-DG protein
MQCSNSHKQVSLALHNYHDVNNTLPAINSNVKFANGQAAPGYSALFVLCPYIEQTARYESVLSNPTMIGAGNPHLLLQGTIPALLCPSDGDSTLPGQNTTTAGAIGHNARSSIVLNVGDQFAANSRPNAPVSKTFGISRAPFYSAYDNTDKVWVNVFKPFAAITDGLSNTVGISETLGSTSENSNDAKRFVVYLDMTGSGGEDVAPYTKSPAFCRDSVLDPNDRSHLLQSVVDATGANVHRGHNFAQGFVARIGFTAALPPNSPSCNGRYSTDHNDNARQGWGIFSVTSNHTGGVNIGLLDGSVRFISDTIDSGDLNAVVVSSGPSPYRVWGALATVNGCESVGNF